MRCQITNSFLILRDAYGDELRLSPDDISCYSRKENDYHTEVVLKNGRCLQLQITAEELDQALRENLYMIKKAYAANDISNR